MINDDNSSKALPNASRKQFSLFLTEQELASRWKVSHQKLANDRWQKIGCPYVKLGRSIRYRIQDVEAYENQCLVSVSAGGSNAKAG